MNESNSPLPSASGAYVLLIHLENPKSIEVGRLGTIDFPAGWYAYIGSALNGIAARVNRHLRHCKKLHWHVDYLLRKGQIDEVTWALSDQRLECRIADTLQQRGLPSIRRFGASDCRCPSHLFHSPSYRLLQNEVSLGFTSAGVSSHQYTSMQGTAQG